MPGCPGRSSMAQPTASDSRCLEMESICLGEDWHEMESIAQDIHLWVLSLSPSLGCQCWAEPNHLSKERGFFYNYFFTWKQSHAVKSSTAVFGTQHCCALPSLLSLQKLGAQLVAWRQQGALSPGWGRAPRALRGLNTQLLTDCSFGSLGSPCPSCWRGVLALGCKEPFSVNPALP